MSQTNFTHLHVHSEYSLLDGGASVKKLIEQAKLLGMDSLALTDHGNMFGAIEFYSKARAAGIKPILGMEAYIAPGSRTGREAGGIKEASHHLLILAQNLQGYHNLLKLSSLAYKEGFYYRPRIDRDALEQFHEGLIVTSACMSGEISAAITQGNSIKARSIAEYYLELLGERFYIEIQQHCAEQNALNAPLIDLAQKLGAGLVATNDVHFLTADDYQAHQVLCCISTGKLIDDPSKLEYPRGLYLKSPEEMRRLFAKFPEACDNTRRIAEACDLELDFSKQHAPVYHPPEKKSSDDYLEELCRRGVAEKYKEITPEIQQRLDRELHVIKTKGFSSYFLIVWDFMNYARRHDIPCGTRGSGVGTLVGYVLDISNVDPLEYGLLFERFMDPERNEMPDIDVDICQNGRGQVIDYVREKYGHVAQIITFGTMKARAAVRDVCRVLNIGLRDADKLAKLVPETLGITLADALEQEPQIQEWCDKDPKIAQALEVSQRLEGLARHASVHAAGVVVADQPLDNFLPLYKAADSDEMITQFDGPTVEKVGLLKMDFLGLRTLSIIERARQLVKLGKNIDIDPRQLDLTDSKTLELFAQGKTKGVFQFESGGMRDLLQKMRPDRIGDLIAANALYRPGPMTLIGDYNSRKHGQSWSLPHPIMEEILNETYGIMVYQEQVMQILNRLGDIPLARAYRLIKAISKKKQETIQAERETFVAGSVAKGIEKGKVKEIFELILRFGGYGFNKSHSTQYAILAFQTAYFKSYYPTEFMAALLTFEMVSCDKVAEYIDECKQMGIQVLPPDINECFADFTVIYDQQKAADVTEEVRGQSKGEQIRFGLEAVKGVGGRAVEEIIRARQEVGKFETICHFCQSINTRIVNKGALEALIKAGAFDSLGGNRNQMIHALENAIAIANDLQKDKEQGQLNFFQSFDQTEDVKNDSAKLPEVEPWPKPLMLQYEKDVLGMYVTSHPLADYAERIYHYSTANTSTLSEQGADSEVIIGGIISRLRFMVTKNGRGAGARMAMFTLEDLSGSVEGVIFPDTLVQFQHLVEVEKMVFISGAVDFRREDPSLRVSAVYDMTRAAEELTEEVCTELDDWSVDDKKLNQFRTLCESHPGKCPVLVSVITPQQMRVDIQVNSRVRPDTEFCRKLEALLGHQRYRLRGRRDSLNRTRTVSPTA